MREMMLWMLIVCFSTVAYSQDPVLLDSIHSFETSESTDGPILSEEQVQKILANYKPIQDETSKRWIIRLYLGYGKAFYGDTQMRIRSDEIDAYIQDVSIIEQDSFEHLEVWNVESFEDALEVFHEPTFVTSLEAEVGERITFGLDLFHNKFAITNHKGNPGSDPIEIESVENEELLDVEDFSSLFKTYRISRGFFNLEGFVDVVVYQTTTDSGYTLKFKNGLGVGMYAGFVTFETNDLLIKDASTKPKVKPMGVGASWRMDLTLHSKSDRWAYQLQTGYQLGQLNYDIGDFGKASHGLNYIPVNFRVGYRLFDSKRKDRSK